MKLNQAIGIEFVGLRHGDHYRVITSQDGIAWSDVDLTTRVYVVDAG